MEATITMYGHHRSIHLPIYGAKVFAVRSGTIDIHGAPVTPTWTFLESAGNTGDTSIIIQTPDGLVGWNVGDRIAIAPTGAIAIQQNCLLCQHQKDYSKTNLLPQSMTYLNF